MARDNDDSWWEAFAAEVIPGPQKAIIDALKEADRPLTDDELLVATEKRKGRVGRRIAHHLGRLRGLNAIEIVAGESGSRPIRYRLTEKPGRVRHSG